MEARQLLAAFTWHAIRGNIDSTAIFPGCGLLTIQAHTWPSYGFDEFFMTVAAYPRLAQYGMLTFVPSFAKSQILTLDVEYVTWGNPASEVVYFANGNCCGVNMEAPVLEETMVEGSDVMIEFPEAVVTDVEGEVPEEAGPRPKVTFIFLTRGDVHQHDIWSDYLAEANGKATVLAHTVDVGLLGESSFLRDRQIRKRVDTSWGSISLVRATLELLREALEDSDATHFMLVSESCVPVRSFRALSNSLSMDSRSRMHVQPWEEVRRRNLLKAQRLENLPGIRKEIAHFQDQWMCLDREDALLVTEKDWTSSFESVLAPDEAYFATVLAASGKPPLQALVNRAITWTEWERGGVNPLDVQRVPPRLAAQIVDSGCYFARKFGARSDIGRWNLHVG